MIETQDVHLKPLLAGEDDARKAVERNLTPRAAGSLGKQRAFGQEILADRIRRQVDAKLWNLTGDIGRGRVAVWAGPGAILVRIGSARKFVLAPPLQCKGIEAYEQTWDLLFRYHKPGTAFDIQELAVTAGQDVAFAVAIMRCGPNSSSNPADKDGSG